MNKIKRIALKNELWAKIKLLGQLYGEDDDLIKEYAIDVYSANMEDLEGSIKCFSDLIDQAVRLRIKKL